MTYITIADVRRSSGVGSDLLDDSQVTAIIEIVEKEMERWINTKFTPYERIEFVDGTGTNFMFTEKNPLLALRSISSNDSDLTLSDLKTEKESGQIIIKTASPGKFLLGTQKTIVKYIYGLLDYSDTQTSSTAATTAGSSVAIAVSSETGFSTDDWIEIYGVDGNREVAKITGTNTNEITVDTLSLTHAIGSIVVLLQIPFNIKRYMEIEASIYCAINAVGATYTFNASYNIMGQISVVKGVPHTHWRESIQSLFKEREMRRKRIKPRPMVVV